MIDKILDECIIYQERSGITGIPKEKINKNSIGYQQTYSLCFNFLEAFASVNKGAVIEIGCRFGGSSILFLTAMRLLKKAAMLLTVDPWVVPCEYVFNNAYRDFTKVLVEHVGKFEKAVNLGRFEQVKDFNICDLWMNFSVTDTIFMENVYPTLPERYKKYFFVFLDGPHTFDPVAKEFKFFQEHLYIGGKIVIDDFGPASDLHKWIISNYPNFKFSVILNGLVYTKKG